MDDITPQPPVRLCCMERHWGVVCNDGLVRCCLCFGRFPVEKLNKVPGGIEDVCAPCAEKERQHEG